MSLPQKIWTFIVTLPKRIMDGLRDPKQRKKWFFQAIKAFAALVLLLAILFVLTWLGLFGSIPDNKA